MKSNLLIISILCLILLGACVNKKDQAQAWAACSSASGNPTETKVNGKVYEIDNLYEGQPRFELQSRNEGAMRYGFKYLYQEYENFTQELLEASTVLCVEATTTLVRNCVYNTGGKDYTLRLNHIDANLKLITWPSREVIAQTTMAGPSFGKCPSEVWHDSNETSYDVYDGLDLNGWLGQYVTITE
jgi:hypothetical protein